MERQCVEGASTYAVAEMRFASTALAPEPTANAPSSSAERQLPSAASRRRELSSMCKMLSTRERITDAACGSDARKRRIGRKRTRDAKRSSMRRFSRLHLTALLLLAASILSTAASAAPNRRVEETPISNDEEGFGLYGSALWPAPTPAPTEKSRKVYSAAYDVPLRLISAIGLVGILSVVLIW
ncbi:hypothetical protein ACHAXT_003400 [Thalassiosira profunda]